MRWIVGDLQGCAREFDDLLTKIRFDPAADELWVVGDLVNRGPDSYATLRLWRDIGGRAVVGNHDVYAVLVAAGQLKRRRDTLHDLLAASDGAELIECLRQLPLLAYLPAHGHGRDAWIVHAGIHPHWNDLTATAARLEAGPHDDAWMRRAEVVFATTVRCCTASGERSDHKGDVGGCVAPYFPWDTFYRGPTLVVHGHWARRGLYRGAHTLGLDSGCVWGGPLTAWCQQEDRIVSVPSRDR